MDCLSRLQSPDNLYLAYRRARHSLESHEGLLYFSELCRWEADLEHHLEKVRALLANLDHPIPCRLVPIPKAEGTARAYYHIPLEYQVGWIAIVQSIGPLIDKRMPSWSFGYRLFRPRMRTLKNLWLWEDYIGDPRLYLGFGQAWKPFRRYINLTLQRMLGQRTSDDPVERAIAQTEEQMQGNWPVPDPGETPELDLRAQRFSYFAPDWPQEQCERIWFAQIDIRKFFPSVQTSNLAERIVAELQGLTGFEQVDRWRSIFKAWLAFEEDVDTFPPEALEILKEERVCMGGLPVGLIASGFLSNVHLLPIDRKN